MAETTLYRKYRPLRFADLVGQGHVSRTLQNEVRTGQLAHAWLLTGPRGVGKTSVARILARAVNCTGRAKDESEPDNTCPSCVSILQSRALDVIEVDAASQTGVDNVRENIIANARVSPVALKKKVFIIDEVHMLSIGAFNALLKLLEEPPAHALFILATTEVHKVPETIVSRCQRFDFHRVSIDELVQRLRRVSEAEQVRVDDEVLRTIAQRAEGGVRDADSLLGQVIALGEKNITIDTASLVLPRTNSDSVLALVQALVQRDRVAALRLIHQYVDDGVDMSSFIRQLIDVLRAAVLLKVETGIERASLVVLDAAQEAQLREIVGTATEGELTRALSAFYRIEREVKSDPLPQLPVELAILTLLPDDGAPLAKQPVTVATAVPKKKKPASVSKDEGTSKADTANEPQPMRSVAESTPQSTTVDQLTQHWPALIQAMKKVNHGSAVFLKTAVPVDVKGNEVLIGVRFPFHAERLMEGKHRQELEKVLGELLAQPVTVRVSVAAAPTSSAADPLLNDLAKAFGGEVL